MFRALSVCALILVLPLVCRADDKPEPTETVIQVTVQPAPAPKPALRYQLLPELQEMNPGNAAQAYLQCFMEQNNFFYRKDAVENREKWQTMPLKDLPMKELREFGYGKGSGPLRRADYAARLDKVDWQMLLKEKKEGIKLLLPELQPLRTLGSALKVRFRVEVAERRFDDALVTAKTLFALARHLEEHPTLISELVGIAIAYMAIGPLDEMIQQPGCPNLFWALTDLPKPLISTRSGCQGERILLADLFALLDDRAPMTEAQLKEAVERVQEVLIDIRDPDAKKGVDEWRGGRLKDESYVAGARKRLIEFGLPAEGVKQFPPLQALLLDDKITYQLRRDEGQKAMSLPYWQAEPLFIAWSRPRHDAEEKSVCWWV